MKGLLLTVFVIAVLLLAIVVGARNSDIVNINYLIAQVELRVSTFMVICLVLGFLMGITTIILKYLALRLRYSNLKRKLQKISADKPS